jgi:hypothetical protein
MLSIMAKGFFTSSPLLFYPVLALMIFVAVFTFITIRVLRSDKGALSRAAALPLADELPTRSMGISKGESHD